MRITSGAFALLLAGCTVGASGKAAVTVPAASVGTPSFAEDLAFMRQHTDVVLLQSASGQGQVVVAPAYQGRVMTSSTSDSGPSFGFISRTAIASKQRVAHINVFGGEDRFWLGPEGGQYGLYFAPADPFELAHWQVPEPIDWGAWQVLSQSTSELRLQREMQLRNHTGTQFQLRVERTVRVLERSAISAALGVSLPEQVEVVGYESENVLFNLGQEPWTKQSGLLSIWILGMFNPSPDTTVVIPFRPGPEQELGPIVNDAYFGEVPADRLAIGAGVLFFRGDGMQRSKIGISPRRALPVVGAYAARDQVLTLVQYTLPAEGADYVNSMWEVQAEPYSGDVVNSYNDGPPEPGKPPLGPFYELETSSKAAALAPGQSLTHVHSTTHLTGSRVALDAVAQRVLGVGLSAIEAAFAQAGS